MHDEDSIKILTYGEIATARNITAQSARNLVRRKKWEKTKGNDGKTRVKVPGNELDEQRTSAATDVTHHATHDTAHDAASGPATINAREHALIVQVAQLEKENELQKLAIAELKDDRDAWRELAKNTIKKPLWKRLLEKK